MHQIDVGRQPHALGGIRIIYEAGCDPDGVWAFGSPDSYSAVLGSHLGPKTNYPKSLQVNFGRLSQITPGPIRIVDPRTCGTLRCILCTSFHSCIKFDVTHDQIRSSSFIDGLPPAILWKSSLRGKYKYGLRLPVRKYSCWDLWRAQRIWKVGFYVND
jgi:hypothetical protein